MENIKKDVDARKIQREAAMAIVHDRV